MLDLLIRCTQHNLCVVMACALYLHLSEFVGCSCPVYAILLPACPTLLPLLLFLGATQMEIAIKKNMGH